MTVQVKIFGVLADRVGAEMLSCHLPADATVAVLLDHLAVEHEAFATMRDRLAVAVNLEYVKAQQVLREGDEVAVIPPVSGG